MIELAPLGDRGLTVRLGERVDRALVAQSHALAVRLRAAALPAVEEIVPGYAAVTLFYDAARCGYGAMAAAVEALLDEPLTAAARVGREHVITVRYDGPDLDEVARRTGLTVADVIARHSGRAYTVYLIGFVPGFAYLGDLDPALMLPRRDEPRPRVPAGSVAIAGLQTAVYPLDTPGGWHLIGGTGATLFDPRAEPPARLAAGDTVRFVAEAG